VTFSRKEDQADVHANIRQELVTECNDIKDELRISTHRRPQWDARFLRDLGMQVTVEEEIAPKVRTDKNMQDNLAGYKLYRKLLAEAKDHSIKIVAIGFVSSLVQLLESGPDEYSDLPGRELVRRKVDSLYFMATKLGKNNDPGYNLRYDIPLSKRFLTEWPQEVKVYLSPSPVGGAIEYPADLVMKDLEKTTVHPILQVYLNKDCNTGQKMWDFLCVVNAVKPELFSYSQTGFVSLDEAGKICFTKDKQGNFIFQLPGDKKWNDNMLSLLRFYGK
jgi:hypothetical protein